MSNHEKNGTHSQRLGKSFSKPKKIVLIISLLLIIPTLNIVKPVFGRTILVPADYGTIQAAVDAAASSGDIIQVSAGTYYEHVVIRKSVTITGQSPQTTIVDGTNSGTIFFLQNDANNVYITGFTIRNAGNGFNAIVMENDASANDNHRIINNIITTSQYGISLSYSDQDTIFNNTLINNPIGGISLSDSKTTNISRNIITDSAYGIRATFSINNNIINNTITNTSHAIHLTSTSTGNIIRSNTLSGKAESVYSSSDSTTIDHNTIKDGGNYGIYLYNCKTASIYYNTFIDYSTNIRLYWSVATASTHNVRNNKIQNSDWGIELVNANGNTIMGNWIQQNTYGVYMTFSSSNTFYRNNFVQNNVQAYAGTGTGNLWSSGGQGNYWSDYTGADANGDGIGDTPYAILPSGTDNYPLMTTWSEHDISTKSVTLSTTQTYAHSIVNISVTVKNNGKISPPVSETFTLTAKYNSSIIETKIVSNLAQGETRIIKFNWNTSEVSAGNYGISALANAIPDELNTNDNTLTDGTITIKMPGDINGDGKVDILDVSQLSAHWYPGPPIGPLGYDPNADINNDGAIDIIDLAIISAHWSP